MLPGLFFFLKIAFALWNLLWIYTNWFFFYFCKKCHWNLDRDCMESIDGFRY